MESQDGALHLTIYFRFNMRDSVDFLLFLYKGGNFVTTLIKWDTHKRNTQDSLLLSFHLWRPNRFVYLFYFILFFYLFFFLETVDPDETAYHEPSHQDIHCHFVLIFDWDFYSEQWFWLDSRRTSPLQKLGDEIVMTSPHWKEREILSNQSDLPCILSSKGTGHTWSLFSHFVQGRQHLTCLLSCTTNPFWKWIYSKRKEFVGSKFFPFRVDPFQKGD